jgi:AcrR family transcriptional regulator
MPRPRSLSPDRLAAAAIAVIDRDGLAGLSMRTVAGELGLSTMALYRYVRDRDELELLVVEGVLHPLDTTPPPDPSWTDQIKTMVDRVRAAVGAHPGIVPLLLRHRQSSVSTLRWSEAVLGILTRAGFDGAGRVVALRALISYVNGAIQLEHLGALSGAGTVAISKLSPADFPLMAATAGAARTVAPDEEFGGGLEILLRGLAATRPAEARERPGDPAPPARDQPTR